MPDEHTLETAEVCVPGAGRARGDRIREADREAMQGASWATIRNWAFTQSELRGLSRAVT